ncbi:MAG: hypothetical protein M3Q81_01330 [bacterium]|nr:hypothetical protein [bacterium]
MNKFGLVITVVLAISLIAGSTWWIITKRNGEFISPLSVLTEETPKQLPLLAFNIPNLALRQYQASSIVVESVITEEDNFTGYLFSYRTLNKRMTGMLNVPKMEDPATPVPAIVMLRGFAPLSSYTTGVGTRNGGRYYANNGYVTLAPDFFGYGDSDAEPEDSWQARFEKPINVIELMRSIENQTITIPASLSPSKVTQDIKISSYGLWGHSNGGQIALTVLEVTQQPIPTTLWAPVTAPFPYSVLFFTDENEDEGKGMRKWLSIFERDYDVFDFTLTKHLDKLTAPIQLHHGTADEAALKSWSDDFAGKIRAENLQREKALALYDEKVAAGTPAAEVQQPQPPIQLNYYSYPGADHNLQPGWDTVVARDVTFFDQYLRPGTP